MPDLTPETARLIEEGRKIIPAVQRYVINASVKYHADDIRRRAESAMAGDEMEVRAHLMRNDRQLRVKLLDDSEWIVTFAPNGTDIMVQPA